MKPESKSQIAEILDLNEDASDTAFIKAVKALAKSAEETEDKFTKAETEIAKIKAALATAEASLAKEKADAKAINDAAAALDVTNKAADALAKAKTAIVKALEDRNWTAADAVIAPYLSLATDETKLKNVLDSIALLPVNTVVIKAPNMKTPDAKNPYSAISGLEKMDVKTDPDGVSDKLQGFSKKMSAKMRTEAEARYKAGGARF